MADHIGLASPPPAASHHATIVNRLRKRDERLSAGMLAKLIGGVVVWFLTSASIAVLVVVSVAPPSLAPAFWQSTLVLALLGLFLAWYWSNDALLEQVRYLGQMYGPLKLDQPFTQTSWDFDVKGRGAEVLFAIGFLILGPQTIWSVIRQWRERRKLHSLDFNRAAEVIAALLPLEHGIPPTDLRRPDEDGRNLAIALAFLRLQEWIDVGAKTPRVWLLTTSRELFAKDMATHHGVL